VKPSMHQEPVELPGDAALRKVCEAASHAIIDRDREVTLALCCIVASGNLLIEDLPGVGKTTLVKVLAAILDLEFKRIQFTNDLLPADILGGRVFDGKDFTYFRGPIFSEIVLGDELNRASPRTQSAVLQAMDEQAVTIDGETHQLPRPFLFIATQNPHDHAGTAPLPESQLDRFLMRIHLGTPSRTTQEKLLALARKKDGLATPEALQPIYNRSDLLRWQSNCPGIYVAEVVARYLIDLVEAAGAKSMRLSPRTTLGLQRAAQAHAYLNQRDHVLPDDVQAMFPHVLGHRLGLSPSDASVLLSGVMQEITPP